MVVYVGAYTRRGSKGIAAFDFNPSTGALAGTDIVGGGVKNPSFIALHPNHRFLYAVSEEPSEGSPPEGRVAAFAIDKGGRLTLLGLQSSAGTGPCFVTVDHGARNVLVANYGSGSVAVLPIGPDGALAPPSDHIQHAHPSRVDPSRQDAPHAHTIHVDASDRFAIACDLGLDKLLIYRYDPAKGKLTPNSPPFTATQPGAGPRQFAFHPNGKFGYLVNELDSTIVAFRWDDRSGILTTLQTQSSLPEGYHGPRSAPAEVQVHPSGKWVYMSNRFADTIAVFAVEAGTGTLKPVDWFPCGGKNPRHFGIDPAGHFLISAHQDSDTLVVHHIHERTGALTPTGVIMETPAPVCVVFLPE